MNLQLVYDLNCQPNSIGDVLTHLQAANCMVEEKGCGEVDVVILHDARLTALTHLGEAAKMSDQVASVNVCHQRHRQEVVRSGSWPPNTHYSTYECWNLIADFFARKGYLPAIRPPKALLEAAKAWLGDAITLQIRNNTKHIERNSTNAEWLGFVKANPSVPIVIVCYPQERDGRFAKFANVRFACDHHGIAMQLAMVYAAPLHLGLASGPAQMRWYQDRPFAVFAEPIKTNRVRGMEERAGRKRMPWMRGWPLIVAHEKTETIQREFDEMRRAA